MPIIIKKYEFYTKKIYVIKFINMDPKKIKAIVNQQDLKSIISLKLFLRFYNYY